MDIAGLLSELLTLSFIGGGLYLYARFQAKKAEEEDEN